MKTSALVMRRAVFGLLLCFALPFESQTAEAQGLISGAWYKLVAKHSGKCLDVYQASADGGTAVDQFSDNGTVAQQWRIDYQEDGCYTLTARCSGCVLDVSGGQLSDGATVIQWPDHQGDNQRWRIIDEGDGSFALSNKNSGLFLDVDHVSTEDFAKVQQWSDNGGSNQRWRIELLPDPALLAGATYTLRAKHSGKYLDSSAGSGPVQQMPGADADSQRWLMTGAGFGFRLTNRATGEDLAITDAALDDGATAIQEPAASANSHVWSPVDVGGGFYELVAFHSGKVLDVDGARTDELAKIQQWTEWGGDNQRWLLKLDGYDTEPQMGANLTYAVVKGVHLRFRMPVSGIVHVYADSGVVSATPASAGDLISIPTTASGVYSVSVDSGDGQAVSIQVTVVDVVLPTAPIADQIGFTRPVTVDVQPAGAPITFVSSNPAVLSVGVPTYANGKATFLVTAHVGSNAEVLAQIRGPLGIETISRQQVVPFLLTTTADTTIPIIAKFPDGTWMGEGVLVMEPLIHGLQIHMTAFSGGLTFDDSTTVRDLSTDSFAPDGASGTYTYHLLRAPGGHTQFCHTFVAIQDGVTISY